MGSGQPDYMNVTLLKGQDSSGNLITIAVDEDGNLISVMKGEYAGSLKNLAVDEQGRMLAVLTDPEDVFGNPHQMGASELAARLGSICNYDRQGSVVWMDDFEGDALKWDKTEFGTGANVSDSIDFVKNGNKSVEMTAGSNGGALGAISKWFQLPLSTRYGFEISISFGVGMDNVQFTVIVYTGVTRYFVRIKIDVDNDSLEYQTGSTTWATLSSEIDLRESTNLFYTLKFVFDTSTHQWVRVLFQNQSYDLSGVALYSDASIISKGMWVDITARGPGVSNPTVYLDDFILTQNEP